MIVSQPGLCQAKGERLKVTAMMTLRRSPILRLKLKLIDGDDDDDENDDIATKHV